MAKQSLTSMPLNALVQLRNRVGQIINRRTAALKKELRALGEDYKEVGRIAIYGKKKAKSKKAGRPGRPAGRKAAAQTRRPKAAKRSAKKRGG